MMWRHLGRPLRSGISHDATVFLWTPHLYIKYIDSLSGYRAGEEAYRAFQENSEGSGGYCCRARSLRKLNIHRSGD